MTQPSRAGTGPARRKAWRRRMPAGVAAGLAAALCCMPAPAQADAEYDALIQRARTGDYGSALAMLRERVASAPSDRRAAHDRIIIAGWAGHCDEVLAAYGELEQAGTARTAPPQVLAAAAGALRDQKRWDEALARYREGRQRFPAEPVFALGEVGALADGGQAAQAVAAGQALVRRQPDDVDSRLALAYAQSRAGEPYEALFEADQAYSRAPKRADAVRAYVAALQRAGLPDAALRVAGEHQTLFDTAARQALELDAAAELVRLADMPTRMEAERFAIADRALARYDALLPALKGAQDSQGEALYRRARIDRLGALHARLRMQDVVDSYEALRAEGVAVPVYALGDVASAYLYLRHPGQAVGLFRQVREAYPLGLDPETRLKAQTGLYYANAEAEALDPAGEAVSEARAEQPQWRWVRGQPARRPNDLWLSAEQTATLARLQADDTAQAQQRTEDLVRNAPGHSGLRAGLANVYLARGWPRAAEQELKAAETLAPRALAVEVQQGHAALGLQEWRQAEMLRDDTLARFPEDLTARRLAREWAVHNKAELRIEGYRGLANDSPVVGDGNFGIESVLYTPPIHYDWRAFGGVGYATGRFDEGRLDYRWARAGVQRRVRDLTIEAELSMHGYGYGARQGGRVALDYDLDDRWRIGASAAMRSTATPLQALLNGIYANNVQVYGRWRASEASEWMLTVAPSHFSDGNDRLEGGISGMQRVYTAPHLKADLLVDLWSSRNSRTDVPYYSPRADLTVLPSARLTHTLYRRYETAWEQQFLAGAGTYSQQGFGTGAILLLGYGQRFRTNDVFDMGATVTATSRPYDGQRERELRIVFDLTYRF
ncbi:poly-beta-1,6 N-acetyl-D-glucosamine export porin PgaA [Cupriavidus sp. AcVe19-1a]|uniref:poly-beta-1,6 N-acetyl-D-glucosamine export porin PgaA n=1 Tax=Cupriavidus sp. AcVe19-1a TaxID=2821359 RepID=UPI001FD7E209|nr:poly-beta-1,6 N-acetyl-D-glucosamine export porin PgaA [Cupriavidus sp. AcVe19-1a]